MTGKLSRSSTTCCRPESQANIIHLRILNATDHRSAVRKERTIMALKVDPPTLLAVMPYAKRQRSMLKTRYGLTPEGYNDLYQKQKGCCRICGGLMQIGRKEKAGWKNGCCVDHIAGTKLVRGLLCHRCNTVIGLMDHDKQLLKSAITYLHDTTPFPKMVEGLPGSPSFRAM